MANERPTQEDATILPRPTREPCDIACTPYEGAEWQARVRTLGFTRGLLEVFVYNEAFRHGLHVHHSGFLFTVMDKLK